MLAQLYYELVSRPRAAVLRDHLVELIPAGASVLDVGCGDGLLASLILERRPDVSLTGIDIQLQPHAQLRVEQYDGERIPYRDRSFDSVLLVDVLHHTGDPAALLGEARRVARNSVIVKDHNSDGFAATPLLRLMDWLGNSPYSIVLSYNYWPEDRWRATFNKLGLTIVEYRSKLGLYPRPASWVFDRSLHFISLLRVN